MSAQAAPGQTAHPQAKPDSTAHAPVPAAPAAAPPTSPGAVKDKTALAQLADKLAHASSPAEARGVEGHMEALRAKPLGPTAMLLLRRAQRDIAATKPGDAIEDLGDALALQGDVPLLWRLRGQARLAAGDTDGAVADLGVALQRDPDDVLSWQVLSQVEEDRGDGKAAIEAWKHVLTLDPLIDGGAERAKKLELKAFGQPT